ncbi:Molybdopterin synthase sulfur carrier subunit [Tieghemiomyces parasiticus]|uniref:Molybdopterin synthase sulfur carrier subunit n=1 Tax=Tieghemiomyces parasiticus TaxID=78921 RepID=A0A9W8DUM2_9FUNG|nr:Molybdopterin synthase sulfur carrier subunit [Tieghemiomyces parasiticus]
MSFGRPPNVETKAGSPPDRGSFPLDHEGECRHFMSEYLSCLKLNKGVGEPCRHLSKRYLKCRMEKGLMSPEEWEYLGFEEDESKPADQTIHEWTDGADYILITPDALDFAALINRARDHRSGAVSSFIGTTRDTFEDKTVATLQYEAYGPMATKKIGEIIREARDRWALHHINVGHKVGGCPVGDISVVIAVSSAHRHESLAAVQYVIDRLKERVPIWKKETFVDGTGQWKANAQPTE